MAQKKRGKKAGKKKVVYELKRGVKLEPGYSGWGGYRPGAGRKKSEDSGVAHTPRGELKRSDWVLVSLQIVKGRPKLLAKEALETLREVFELAKKDYFEILQYKVQERDIHLLVKADDRESLGRGMGGLGSRMSRRLNRIWGKRGTVYADRYADLILHTQAELKKAQRGIKGGGSWKKLA